MASFRHFMSGEGHRRMGLSRLRHPQRCTADRVSQSCCLGRAGLNPECREATSATKSGSQGRSFTICHRVGRSSSGSMMSWRVLHRGGPMTSLGFWGDSWVWGLGGSEWRYTKPLSTLSSK